MAFCSKGELGNFIGCAEGRRKPDDTGQDELTK